MAKVIILCGGRGTRLKEHTDFIPKPMVELGGKPLLWHIMKIYAHHGFKEFVLPLGYKGEVIRKYFMDRNFKNLKVHMKDTGEESLTAKRIYMVKDLVKSDDFFMMTYGDGVADIDINRLLEFHKSKGRLATISATQYIIRFGEIDEEGGIVKSFVEKPKSEKRVNMGFAVFNRAALDYFTDENVALETDVLVRLAKDDQLAAYHHDSFWFPMDTQRDYEDLTKIWETDPKWKIWKHDEF